MNNVVLFIVHTSVECYVDVQMYNEAGGLYEKCELWEKAAGVFVKSKNWLVQWSKIS